MALAGCADWKEDYRAAYRKIEAVLKDCDELTNPSQDNRQFGFRLEDCDGVIDRSRSLKDTISALATPNLESEKAKALLLDVLRKNAEEAELAKDFIKVTMETMPARIQMMKAIQEAKEKKLIAADLDEDAAVAAMDSQKLFAREWDWRSSSLIHDVTAATYGRAIQKLSASYVLWMLKRSEVKGLEGQFRDSVGLAKEGYIDPPTPSGLKASIGE